MSTEKLEACLDCPFCGEEIPAVPEEFAGRRANYNICCDDCGMRGPAGFGIEEAIGKWNALPRTSLPGGGEEWQDIATAPRDGTYVLVWSKGWGIDLACNDPCVREWRVRETAEYDNDCQIPHPTHWQPLPEPPALPQSAKEGE